jgi:hypothetical protein
MGKTADLLQERGQLDQALRIRAQGRNGVTPGGSRSIMARGAAPCQFGGEALGLPAGAAVQGQLWRKGWPAPPGRSNAFMS